MNQNSDNAGAVLMAGGRGCRMGSLTEHTPKPLLPVSGRGHRIIDYALGAVRDSGVAPEYSLVCTAYRGDQIEEHLRGTGYTVVDVGTGSIAGDLLEILDRCPETFLALSCDLYTATVLKEIRDRHDRATVGATLAFARVPDAQWSQKHWRYGVREERLVSLGRQEATTEFEKAGLVLERHAVALAAERVAAILGREPELRGSASPFGDGWHLLLHCLLEAGVPVAAVELEICPCLNLNRPEHLVHAEAFVEKWNMNPLMS